MNQSFTYNRVLRESFREELLWYEKELDLMFNHKPERYIKQDLDIGNQIIDKFTEVINRYHNEDLLQQLIKTLNKIERKYPEFF